MSLVIVSLAFGFVIWASIRLISGELSTSNIVGLYEREKGKELSPPPFASRITLYRVIFVLFSFLYLTWSNCYLTFEAKRLIIGDCHFGDSKNAVQTAIDSALGLPKQSGGIYLITFIIVFLISMFVVLYYFSELKYLMRAKSKKHREEKKLKEEGASNNSNEKNI